ncbi:long-chain-fatty-acid--CoA ligase, partial [Effusibacillus lacus]
MVVVSELERNLVSRVCVGDMVTRSASRFPNKVAIKDGERVLTYKEFNNLVNRCGHGLLQLGLEHQDKVAIMTRNSWEMLVLYFACAKAGLIAMPINLGLKAPEIAYCMNDSGAKVLVAESVFAGMIGPALDSLPALQHVYWCGSSGVEKQGKVRGTFDELLDSGAPEEVERIVNDRDIVQLLYTSGTTSMPKGVLTSHVAVSITALTNALQTKMDHRDQVMALLPLFHCAQLNALTIPSILTGAGVVILKAFDPQQVADGIEQERMTITLLLPVMYQALLGIPGVRERDFSSVRMAVYGMAFMPQSRIDALQKIFPNANILLGSGQTEFIPTTTFQRPEHQATKSASWGPATVCTQVAIMDDHGNLLPPGEVGEIVYRGPQALEGYLNRPDKTSEAFRYGWFHSGDVARMDEEGVIWFTDRKKDMVKTGGENVASIEVEGRLLEHPAVLEASVVGLPHPQWGEAVTAFVILKPGQTVTQEELIGFCKDKLAGFKVPKRIEFVESFPRTGTGKIQKHH